MEGMLDKGGVSMTIMATFKADGDSVVSTTTWTSVGSKDFTLNYDNSFVIFISAEYSTSNKNNIAGIRVLLDGVEKSFSHRSPAVADQFMTYTTILIEDMVSGLHNLTLEARTANASYPVTVRRKRMVVMQH